MYVAKIRQRGMALVVTLIMLVIMTLGAIAMVRSMDTTTLIAGNLGFRQSATYSGDVGVEAAMAWLRARTVGTLTCGSPTGDAACPAGYKSNGGNDRPAANQSWDGYWTATLAANATNLAEDATGNRVSYFIHRLCEGTGAITAAGSDCVETPAVASSGGSSKLAGSVAFSSSSQVYYRITVRVQGKKNTVSYVQAIVAL
jgi:Tfp pilus assembly protein PilX